MDARNLGSAKLCENIGIRREAHVIKEFYRKAERTDRFIYGMLALRPDFTFISGEWPGSFIYGMLVSDLKYFN